MELDRGSVDLCDAAATRAAFAEGEAEWVFHLAAEASVARSWREPQTTIRNNLETTLNVLDAARGTRVLVAGSGEVYGPPHAGVVGVDSGLEASDAVPIFCESVRRCRPQLFAPSPQIRATAYYSEAARDFTATFG